MGPHGMAIPADQYREVQERDRFQSGPTYEDTLAAKIINHLRRSVITVSRPAHVDPTIWDNPVDLSERVTVAAAVAANYTTAITFTPDPGRAAVIEYYGVTVQDAAYTYNGSLLWRLTVNGKPLGDGLSDWGIQRGSVIQPRKTFIILNGDKEDTIRLEVRRAVAAGAPQDVDHALLGRYWRLRNTYEGTALSVTAY